MRRGGYIPKEFPDSSNELEGFPRAEAISKAKELIEAMGLDNLGEPIVYSASADNINNFVISEKNKQDSYDYEFSAWEALKIDFDEYDCSLSSDSSFYYIVFPSEINGIEISDGETEWNGKEEHSNSDVKIVIDKNRIVSVDCYYLFENIETIGEYEIKTDAKNAADKLAEYLNYKKTDDYYEFNQCNIRYIASEYKYEKGYMVYTPVWQFSGSCSNDESGIIKKQVNL